MIKKTKNNKQLQKNSLKGQQILEGSHAVALTIKNIEPGVISAYPITPQTHIVEDLAKFKADGQADYEYLRAESEFAAASIILGASAAGARTYSATSSQGLLLMAEVVFSISGLRLPIVMTCANRAISGPINIWNDQQDIMVVRDSGWIMTFAENHQEAVDQHIIAYKLAEALSLPAMVNIDGFILTHSYEPVLIPSREKIKKFLPAYKPTLGTYLNPSLPVTMGALVSPTDYLEIRQDMHEDLLSAEKLLLQEYKKYFQIVRPASENFNLPAGFIKKDDGLSEYYGPKNPKMIIVAMGSVAGTIKSALNDLGVKAGVGLLKIKLYRPFPAKAINKILASAKTILVLDKAISLGHCGPLYADIKAGGDDSFSKKNIQNWIAGLGGRDISVVAVKKIINGANKRKNGSIYFA